MSDPRSTASIAAPNAAAARKKVIVFDDNPDLLELMERVLRKQYEVEVCATLECIEDKVLAFQPDLILMDNAIGSLECGTTVLALRDNAATRHIPVVLISGHAELERLAEQLQVAGHLAKPFSIQQLREYVGELLVS
jgi:CheY-like chemotaxis protein